MEIIVSVIMIGNARLRSKVWITFTHKTALSAAIAIQLSAYGLVATASTALIGCPVSKEKFWLKVAFLRDNCPATPANVDMSKSKIADGEYFTLPPSLLLHKRNSRSGNG